MNHLKPGMELSHDDRMVNREIIRRISGKTGQFLKVKSDLQILVLIGLPESEGKD